MNLPAVLFLRFSRKYHLGKNDSAIAESAIPRIRSLHNREDYGTASSKIW